MTPTMPNDFNLIEAHRAMPRREDETLAEWVARWMEYREREEPEGERERRLR